MFTGLVESIGTVVSLESRGDSAILTISDPTAATSALGDSVAVSGVCLTVVGVSGVETSFDVMGETLHRSTLGRLAPGDRVNIERATRADARLGGHIVQGHVDARGTVLAVTPHERWTVVRVAIPAHLAPLVAEKGSIAVDGVSLTVSAVSTPPARAPFGVFPALSGAPAGRGDARGAEAPAWFEVSLIPETLGHTTLGEATPGVAVNIESDVLARHVARLLEFTRAGEGVLR
ncbi:MAG TPA: riboflavin synthase [Pseudoclavibacter sp.]|nr:riboflavin synthase [Pseudoclavibacter sp.]